MKPIEKILFCLFALLVIALFIFLLWIGIHEPSVDAFRGMM